MLRLHNKARVAPPAATTFLRLHFNKFAAPIADATFVLKCHILQCFVAGQLYWNMFLHFLPCV